LFRSVRFLVRSYSSLKMLSWAKTNSPLLVLLQFVDPNIWCSETRRESIFMTPLHHLAELADPFDYSTRTHEKKTAHPSKAAY
jgi:hypothetical protein